MLNDKTHRPHCYAVVDIGFLLDAAGVALFEIMKK